MNENESNQLSYVFKLQKHGPELEFLDLDLSSDLQVYVDPILLYKSPLRKFNEAHTLIVEFFERALRFVKEGKLHIAESMCHFPDGENYLGIASSGHGHGPREKLGYKIFEELVNNKDIQDKGLIFLNEFQLLIEGISFDLVSDTAVQITKEVFINYTLEQCRIHNIPTSTAVLRHYFDWEENVWDSRADIKLPLNPLKNNEPFLLTPKSIVRRYPEGDYRQFYDEIYKYILYESEQARLWQALGKKPKILFSEIAKKYKRKDKVVAYVKKNPDKRRQFMEKIKSVRDTVWLDNLSRELKVNINQTITPEILEKIESFFVTGEAKHFFNEVKKPILHQLELEKPKKALIPEIISLLRKCKENMILLLGNYTAGKVRLNEIESILAKDYNIILVKDLPKNGSSLQQSVARLSTLARFTIVEDSYPGGQLSEIEILKHIGTIAVILREKGKISSFMSAGSSFSYSNFKEIEYELKNNDGIEDKFVQEAIKWAEKRCEESYKFWEETYPWQKGI